MLSCRDCLPASHDHRHPTTYPDVNHVKHLRIREEDHRAVGFLAWGPSSIGASSPIGLVPGGRSSGTLQGTPLRPRPSGAHSCMKRSFPERRRLEPRVWSELAKNCRLSLNTRCLPQPSFRYFSIPWTLMLMSSPGIERKPTGSGANRSRGCFGRRWALFMSSRDFTARKFPVGNCRSVPRGPAP